MRLSQGALGRLPSDVATPSYDRAQPVGIVHFGIGAFHRAHQAWHTDRALAAGAEGWMIAGVSLRSADVAAQLNPQDGLYTLTERSGEDASTRVIGAVREVLVAGPSRSDIVARLGAPSTHVVSFTVTEKGYARAPDGSLDHRLAAQSFYRPLTEGMRERMRSGAPGLTLLSCDNLADNGRQLAALMRQWLEVQAPDVLGWFEQECTCPATMIDRIVPASTEADRGALAERLRMEDEGAVFTERFSQWVIEDRFAGARPPWEDFGAQLVADVAPFETAKLRMLNGAHSALAYLGLARGHTFVHQAIADPELCELVGALMLSEAAPTIVPAAGQDLVAYAEQLLARFADPALNHRLAQIAMDGSQKIPQRWLATLAIREGEGVSCPAIRKGLAAWFEHLRRGDHVNDPRADDLRAILAEADGDEALARMFGADWRAAARA